jgi:hypothetical protein
VYKRVGAELQCCLCRYYKDAEKTAEVLGEDGWFHTGNTHLLGSHTSEKHLGGKLGSQFKWHDFQSFAQTEWYDADDDSSGCRRGVGEFKRTDLKYTVFWGFVHVAWYAADEMLIRDRQLNNVSGCPQVMLGRWMWRQVALRSSTEKSRCLPRISKCSLTVSVVQDWFLWIQWVLKSMACMIPRTVFATPILITFNNAPDIEGSCR